MSFYQVVIRVEPGQGDHGTDKKQMLGRNMTLGQAWQACEVLEGRGYLVWLFKGKVLGKLVYRSEALEAEKGEMKNE